MYDRQSSSLCFFGRESREGHAKPERRVHCDFVGKLYRTGYKTICETEDACNRFSSALPPLQIGENASRIELAAGKNFCRVQISGLDQHDLAGPLTVGKSKIRAPQSVERRPRYLGSSVESRT
jgi:hypothetical protein